MLWNNTSRRALTGLSSAGMLLLTVQATHAVFLVNDGFGDGDRDNDGVADGPVLNPSDDGVPFTLQRGTGDVVISVVDDSAGIGSGNVLQVLSETTSNRPIGAYFTPVTLADGDRLVLSFDARLLNDPIPNEDRKFRFGLYNSMGTRVLSETAIDTADTDDDAGYLVQVDTGVSSSSSLSIFGDLAGTLLGGSSKGLGSTASDAAYAINTNAAIDYLLTIERIGTDLQLTLVPTYDGTALDARVATDTTPLTYTFDLFAFGQNGGSTPLDYLIDNVVVEYIPIPEPTAAGLVGLLGLGLRRRR